MITTIFLCVISFNISFVLFTFIKKEFPDVTLLGMFLGVIGLMLFAAPYALYSDFKDSK